MFEAQWSLHLLVDFENIINSLTLSLLLNDFLEELILEESGYFPLALKLY